MPRPARVEDPAATRAAEITHLPRPVYFRSYPIPNNHYVAQHQHGFVEFLYARKGGMRVEVDGRTLFVPVFHGIWIPQNTPHQVQASGDTQLESLYISPGKIALNHASCHVVVVSHFVREFIHHATTHVPAHYEETGPNGMLVTVLLHLLEKLPDAGFSLAWPASPAIMQVCRAIQAEPGHAHTIDEWAAHCGMSVRTFSRRFKKETGITFSEWKQKMRLLDAVILLKNNHSVTQVALDLGYSSIASFTYAFRQMFGVPPSRY
ncbi:AraC family transcriptional regulator [Mangrovibacter phragmitis]|uniref:Arabinose operon regulatory protein n=1 Tax=Mangrovibacter phragmitis TaxID=1691903 RepID=A0A1B7L0J7_9ENTR|nr:helix-turn-helix transcriptional regulator [Mangrovibacter phragmitis]OAT75919.1 AraC family transcriptional regulator [Mangrovibacter phragmitis]